MKCFHRHYHHPCCFPCWKIRCCECNRRHDRPTKSDTTAAAENKCGSHEWLAGCGGVRFATRTVVFTVYYYCTSRRCRLVVLHLAPGCVVIASGTQCGCWWLLCVNELLRTVNDECGYEDWKSNESKYLYVFIESTEGHTLYLTLITFLY